MNLQKPSVQRDTRGINEKVFELLLKSQEGSTDLRLFIAERQIRPHSHREQNVLLKRDETIAVGTFPFSLSNTIKEQDFS